MPLHVWLPYAHPAAPSHVSALMSGVMIKTAIYGLIRVYFDFLGGPFPWWWGFVVLLVGTVSALLGVMYALMEHDLKSLSPFISVENIGIILMGIGTGMVFYAYDMPHLAALGIIAGLYHTINHAVFKACSLWEPVPSCMPRILGTWKNMEGCFDVCHGPDCFS